MATKYERITYAPSDLAEKAINHLIISAQKSNLPEVTRTAALNFFVNKGIEAWTNEILEQKGQSYHDKMSEILHRKADRAQ